MCIGAGGRAGSRRSALAILVTALALASIAPDSAWGQTPTTLSGGQGPRSPFVGPASAPPDSEGPPRDASTMPPGRSARCRWDLRGEWESRGRQTDPTGRDVSTRVSIRQYGNYVSLTRGGDSSTYYGVCSGDRLELDAYNGDQFAGAYTGTVSNNGRRIEATWVLFSPESTAGYETLTSTASAR